MWTQKIWAKKFWVPNITKIISKQFQIRQKKGTYLWMCDCWNCVCAYSSRAEPALSGIRDKMLSVLLCISSWLELQGILLTGQQESVMMTSKAVVLSLVLVTQVVSLPPNYEDIESAVDQALGEKVDIQQEDPNSNTIHIAHNNPKDRWGETQEEILTGQEFCFSDIKIVQTNPFNTTIHVSLNVGSGAKVGQGYSVRKFNIQHRLHNFIRNNIRIKKTYIKSLW